MTIINEQTPLVNNYNNDPTLGSITKKDKNGLLLIRFGQISFALFILSVLVRIPLSVFSFHPFFMTIFILILTEGIATLQTTKTLQEKREGLKKHALIQLLAYISSGIGFSAIFYNKIISGKPHFTSFHGQLGIFTFGYLLFQLIFGLLIAFIPSISFHAKKYWKYHRFTGYFLFLIVSTVALAGVQADYVLANAPIHSTFFILISVIIFTSILSGIFLRIRVYKLKGQVITQ
ncbi:unnamed protein product [Cunninghamella blakesleeana]